MSTAHTIVLALGAVMAIGVVGSGCSGATEAPEPETPLPERRATLDGGEDDDASQSANDGGGGNPTDASNNKDTAVDASPPDVLPPLSSYLVLRFESDAKDGLQANTAWRDLSSSNKTITVASGTPKVVTVGSAGAKAMVFDATDGPIFEVPDSADLRFGATDDFFVVARTTIEAPLEGSGGCAFRYIFAKYDQNGATPAPHLRICAPDTGMDLIGALKLSATEAKTSVPTTFATKFDVISFGRNQSGTRLETYAGASSVQQNLAAPVDVSAVGANFTVGGARVGAGTPFGQWIGKVNRLYVYHAPPGMLATTDLEAIRTFVKNAAPLP